MQKLVRAFLLTIAVLAGAPAASAAEPLRPTQLQPSPPTGAVASRVQQLEEDLRRLTGRIEELEFRQRQMEERLRAAATADTPPQAAASPEPPTTVAPVPVPTARGEAPPATAEAPSPAIEPDVAARQGYVLGAIPEGAVRDRTPPPPPPGAASYEAGLDFLQASKWAEAEQAFAAFVQENPDDPRAPAASYWLGETYLLRKDYPTAAAVFARNYRTYGESAPRAADNLLKLGVTLAAMGDKEKACQSFEELARRHANAPAPIRQELSRRRSAVGCT